MSIDFRVGLGGSGTASLGQVVYRGDIPGFTSRADGSVGHSGVTINDPTGTIEIVGLNKFEVNESACDNPRIYTGITTERQVQRSVGKRVTTQRIWDTNIADQNAYLHLRVISDHNHGNRPAETDVARLAWLLDEVLHAGHVIDAGNAPTAGVSGAPRNLDAADFRGKHADDVLSDMGPPGNRRFFCYWDPGEEAVALFYGLNSESLGDSPLRISNVIADRDADTFYPSMDAVLSRDPADVAGQIDYKYRNGRIYREDADTLAEFIDRGIAVENDRVGLASTASTFVDRLLDRASRERDEITVTIQVPKARVNHVLEGQRIEVKFTHLPRYEAFVFVHVKARTVIQDLANPDWYEIRLELCDYIGGLGSGGGGGGAPSTPYQPQPGPAGPGTLYGGQDNTWEVYVNGTRITIADDHSAEHNTVAIAIPDSLLVTGDNVVAVKVGNGVEPQGWAFGNETFLELRVFDEDDDLIAYSTTAMKVFWVSWMGEDGLTFTNVGGTPVNWNEASFNDSGWDAAVDVTGTTANLSAIPPISPARQISLDDLSTGNFARGAVWLARLNFTMVGNLSTPNNGQQVTEAIPGTTAGGTLQTNFPYHPGSLVVNGYEEIPDETDPSAGEFTVTPDTTGQTLIVTYQATGNGGTGASNPTPSPGSYGGGGGGATELDDLTDVTIASPQENDTLRYVAGSWVNDPRRWEPVTFNFGSGPELVWDSDDLVMEWKEY